MAKRPPTLEQLIPQRYDHIADLDDVLAPARHGDIVVGDSVPVEPPPAQRKPYSLQAILQSDGSDGSDPTQK